MKLKVTVNGTLYSVDVEVEPDPQPGLGSVIGPRQHHPGSMPTAPTSASVTGASLSAVVAPLAGSVARVLVKQGDAIEAGQTLVVLEAMKMETEITAPAAGTVSAVLVSPGEAVQAGQALIDVE